MRTTARVRERRAQQPGTLRAAAGLRSSAPRCQGCGERWACRESHRGRRRRLPGRRSPRARGDRRRLPRGGRAGGRRVALKLLASRARGRRAVPAADGPPGVAARGRARPPRTPFARSRPATTAACSSSRWSASRAADLRELLRREGRLEPARALRLVAQAARRSTRARGGARPPGREAGQRARRGRRRTARRRTSATSGSRGTSRRRAASPATAASSARSTTSRPSRSGAARSTAAPTSTGSAASSSSASPASGRSSARASSRWCTRT